MSEVLMKGMLKDELKPDVRNEVNGTCWYFRALDPTLPPGVGGGD